MQRQRIDPIAMIERKFVEYEFIEMRSLFTSTAQTGGTLQPNQRCYFGPNQKLKGKRVIAIDVTSIGTQPATISYQNVPIVFPAGLADFVLTMVDKNGKEVVKSFPVSDLFQNNNNGRLRIFDIIPDIEACYVVSTSGGWGLFQILFNFYTVSW